MMFRMLCTLPLPASLLDQLQEFGFFYCEDLCTFIGGEQITLNTIAREVLKQWYDDPEAYWMKLITPPIKKNAYSLLREECNLKGIETFCKPIDEYMDGGVPLQRITEISGAPGTGKTQLSLQLCVDVQIPRAFHGLQGQAVYIDTHKAFTVSRLSEIAEACVGHCREIAKMNSNDAMLDAMLQFTKDSILQNVFYFHCLDYTDLIASVIYFKELLQKKKEIKLIVVDNITFPLQTITNSVQRVSLLSILMNQLRAIAYQFNIAVVVTNNLTTQIDSDKTSLVPALGESFGHSVNYRFVLGRLSENKFVCASGKNLHKSPSSLLFQVSRSGIR